MVVPEKILMKKIKKREKVKKQLAAQKQQKQNSVEANVDDNERKKRFFKSFTLYKR